MDINSRFSPATYKPAVRLKAIDNPRTLHVLKALEQLDTVSAFQVYALLGYKRAASVPDVAKKLMQLKLDGYATVSRRDLESTDPFAYNLYTLTYEGKRLAAPLAKVEPCAKPVGRATGAKPDSWYVEG